MPAKSIIDQRFGRWTVQRRSNRKPNLYWCLCSCGTTKEVYKHGLLKGSSLSCGCYRKELWDDNLAKAKKYIGSKFGNWEVVDITAKHGFICRCVCGSTGPVAKRNLLSGGSTSCGCTKKKYSPPEHKILDRLWRRINYICSDETNPQYPFFGGKGIKVLFNDFMEFKEHIILLGPKPIKHYLSRIDTTLHFMPGNLKWGRQYHKTKNHISSKDTLSE